MNKMLLQKWKNNEDYNKKKAHLEYLSIILYKKEKCFVVKNKFIQF